MNEYEEALALMQEKFSRDYQFSLATAYKQRPSQRFVDAYYDGGYFYVVTYRGSNKIKEIEENKHVSLIGRRGDAFSGEAVCIGHPLLPENSAIREKLIAAFAAWYFAHNNEEDSDMCYLRIKPNSGFFHYKGHAYRLDFEKQKVEDFPYSFDYVLTEDE